MLAQRRSATFKCLRRTGAIVRGTSPSVRLCRSRARTLGHDRPCSVAIGRGRSAQVARSRQVVPDRDRWVRTSASSRLPVELVERGGGGKVAGVDLRCDPQPLGCLGGDHAAGSARRHGLAARRGAGHSSTMRREMAESSPNELLTREEGQLGYDRAHPRPQLPALQGMVARNGGPAGRASGAHRLTIGPGASGRVPGTPQPASNHARTNRRAIVLSTTRLGSAEPRRESEWT